MIFINLDLAFSSYEDENGIVCIPELTNRRINSGRPRRVGRKNKGTEEESPTGLSGEHQLASVPSNGHVRR